MGGYLVGAACSGRTVGNGRGGGELEKRVNGMRPWQELATICEHDWKGLEQ